MLKISHILHFFAFGGGAESALVHIPTIYIYIPTMSSTTGDTKRKTLEMCGDGKPIKIRVKDYEIVKRWNTCCTDGCFMFVFESCMLMLRNSKSRRIINIWEISTTCVITYIITFSS